MIKQIEPGMWFQTMAKTKFLQVRAIDTVSWKPWGDACIAYDDAYGRKANGPAIGKLIAGDMKEEYEGSDFNMKLGPHRKLLDGTFEPWVKAEVPSPQLELF